MKALNDDLQMRSDWTLPICAGDERLKGADGQKAHSTQKPESLLHRVIVSSTKPGDVMLDPVLRLRHHRRGGQAAGPPLHRHRARADLCRRGARAHRRDRAGRHDAIEVTKSKRAEPRIPFGWVVERGLAAAGHGAARHAASTRRAKVRADGTLVCADATGSIHQIGAHVQGLDACNGWTFWQFEHERHADPDRRAAPAPARRSRMTTEH